MLEVTEEQLKSCVGKLAYTNRGFYIGKVISTKGKYTLVILDQCSEIVEFKTWEVNIKTDI